MPAMDVDSHHAPNNRASGRGHGPMAAHHPRRSGFSRTTFE